MTFTCSTCEQAFQVYVEISNTVLIFGAAESIAANCYSKTSKIWIEGRSRERKWMWQIYFDYEFQVKRQRTADSSDGY